MATSGQTLNDRINAARYALAGQGLARCVCKATTEEVIGPKKKHLDYLLACTHEPNVSIPQLANLLIERTNHIYWVVVFKALVTVHHLMSYGNERFTQYLASSNYSFELSTFLDKTAARDFSMSTFIRRYSRYINEKALSYRILALDFCKVKRGNEGVLRVMPIDKLLKTLPALQNQLDALLEFDCSANDLNNGVINACFMLLFRDLIGLFACHNDGIINLLNKYFTLNKKMCREAFDLYKKFLVRMDKVSDFMRVAEVVGIDKEEIPDLRRAPSSLIDALEQHLQNIESNKKTLKQQSSITTNGNKSSELGIIDNLTPPSSRRPNSPSANNSINNSTQATVGFLNDEFSLNNFKDDEVRKALEEEARVLSQYGTSEGSIKGKSASNLSKISSAVTAAAQVITNSASDSHSPKFAVTTIPKCIDDIFGDTDSFANTSDANNGSPFGDNLSTTGSSSSSVTAKQYQRPDIDSIKSSIRSATTTLEKSTKTSESSSKTAGKKASDDLFSLLDTSNNLPTTTSTSSHSALAAGQQNPSLFNSDSTNPLLSSSSIISPFNASSPFDISINKSTGINGPLSTLKPGNPFPDAVGDTFVSSASSNFASTASIAMAPQTIPQPMGNSIFKSGPSQANYTNLGELLEAHTNKSNLFSSTNH